MDGNINEFNESFDFIKGSYEIRVRSWNLKDKDGDSVVKIGVGQPWDTVAITPSPTPTP